MGRHRITLMGSQENILKHWLNNDPLGYERGAIILFRKLDRKVNGLEQSNRFIAVEIILMDGDWILDSGINHFTINMRKFSDIYYRCETKGFELGFVHNHPNNLLKFSTSDDDNEKNILKGLCGCNTPSSYLISLILANNIWKARIRQGLNPEEIIEVKHLSILSDKIELYNIHIPEDSPENLIRQEQAFGKPFNLKLQSLRVAVVGLGGTGSPIATLLARTGIGELILIDGDKLDESNMNRVSGFDSKSVGENKAIALEKFINSLSLNVSVVAIPNYLNESAEAIDALSSADVIFGCTDDVAGRDLLNQALYYYSQVYIDTGLAGIIGNNTEGMPYLRSQKGRVSCILPESGFCLRCQNVINDQMIYEEEKFKDNPELIKLDPEILKKDYYIFGSNVQSPGIGAFTRGSADNAVATFMNLLTNFRRLPSDLRQDNIWIDFVNMYIHSNTPQNNDDCIYCGKRILLLKGEGKYRLGMPQLGKITEYE